MRTIEEMYWVKTLPFDPILSKIKGANRDMHNIRHSFKYIAKIPLFFYTNLVRPHPGS